MALSKSVIKAQDIISCNLCESETKLKWKCLDCDLLMCNKCCDKVHSKFKNAKDHTIVDIKQVGVSGTTRNLNFTNIKCKEHTAQSCCIFCSNCDKLACPSCITKGHAGHTFIEIKEAYEMKVEWLNKGKVKLEMEKKKLDEGEKALDQISIRENSNFQKTSHGIRHHRETLIREVDKHVLNLTEDLNQNMKNVNDSISLEKKIVKTNRQELENNFKAAEEMLTTMDISFFFENANIIAKSFNDDVKGAKVIHKSVPKFKPGSILQSNVGTFFDNYNSKDILIDMKVNKTFSSGLKRCHFLSACSDGTLWIGDGTTKLLHKVKTELIGNILTTVLNINTELQGIAIIHNNDLLISDGKSKLKLINGQTGKVSDSKYSVDPLWIIAVHMTNDHKVIVGATSPGKAFPVAGGRVVIVMDQEGNHLSVYEQDKHKQNTFSYPWVITSTRNGNIFVIDCLSEDDRARVLVLGNNGNIFNEYTGCHHINTENKPFKPTTISATPSNNIIVSDVYHHHLHILDNTGNLLCYYNTKDIGIEFPSCIVFTSASTFYLGCDPLDGRTTNANLYEIRCVNEL